MPLTATKKAARVVKRRLDRACREVRTEWTNRECRRRRLQAFQMQGRLASVLGL